MHSDQREPVAHHKNRHLAERFEGLLGTLMVVAIVLLAVGLVYGVMTTDSTPSWMR
jgi:cell division protein FtsL